MSSAVSEFRAQRDIAADIAGELETLPKNKTEAEVKAGWKKQVEVNFGRLSDANMSLFLFLRAIECYLKHGQVGGEIAKILALDLKNWWSARAVGSMGGGTGLGEFELAEINKSRHRDEILRVLKSVGIK